MTPQRLTMLGVLATAAFIGALLLGLATEPNDAPDQPVPTSTFSYSLLGHRGLYETLQALKVPVVASQHASLARACGGLLILAEPSDARTDISTVLGDARCPKAVLVVLPKWRAETDARGFVGDLRRQDQAVAAEVLEALALDASLVTVTSATGLAAAGWQASNPNIAAPSVAVTTIQLLKPHDGLRPQLASEAGDILLAQHADYPNLYILADPDLINNTGLQAGHAAFAVGLVTALAGSAGVVFDETIHGYQRAPALWKALFDFPMALLTAHLVVVLLVLLWAFAKHAHLPSEEPAREGGYRYLVRHTASLLTAPAHRRHVLRRYVEACRAYVNDTLGRTAPMSNAELAAREVRKGVTRSMSAITAHMQAATDKQIEQEFLELANAAHAWRLALTEETSREP